MYICATYQNKNVMRIKRKKLKLDQPVKFKNNVEKTILIFLFIK